MKYYTHKHEHTRIMQILINFFLYLRYSYTRKRLQIFVHLFSTCSQLIFFVLLSCIWSVHILSKEKTLKFIRGAKRKTLSYMSFLEEQLEFRIGTWWQIHPIVYSYLYLIFATPVCWQHPPHDRRKINIISRQSNKLKASDRPPAIPIITLAPTPDCCIFIYSYY